MSQPQQRNIPILTDVVAPDEPQALAADSSSAAPSAAAASSSEQEIETLIAELQTRLASSTFALTEEILRAAFSEMEAKLHEQISARLRRELPELIDSLLREYMGGDRDS